MSSDEYTGRSLLDGDGSPAPGASPPAGPPPGPTPRGLLLALEGGQELAVEHDGDPDSVREVRVFGERFLVFADGNHVRADKVVRFKLTTLAEAHEEADRPPEAVPVVLAGMQQVAPQPTTTLDDLPYAMWPLEALEREEKRMDPEGIATSSDLTEIRDAIKKWREKK